MLISRINRVSAPKLASEDLFFIGIDISKKTLDFAVRDQKELLFHLKVNNSLAGLKQFQKECLAKKIDLSQSLICCEHTGVYSQNILALATENDLSLWLESSLRIKRSLGLRRGKSGRRPVIRSTQSESVSMLFGMLIRLLSGNLRGRLSSNYDSLLAYAEGCLMLRMR